MATLRRDGAVVRTWAVDASGSVNLDQYGLGIFELTIDAADGDTDGWDGDTLSATSSGVSDGDE